MARAFLTLLVVLPLAAQQSASLTADASDKARIEGILLSQTNQQPVKKGTLTLRVATNGPQPQVPGSPSQIPSGYLATSDADGKFVFDQVEPGRYTLGADRPGFIRATYRNSRGSLITLGPGQVLKDLRFAITPQGVIAGRVVDEDGDPITEVRVSVMRWGYFNGARQLAGFQQNAVDDQGTFRIANLAAGHYFLSAEINGAPAINTGKAQEAYIATYYPSALDISEATPIAVAAGAEVTNVEIRLHKARVYRVSGKIIDGSSGGAVRNLGVQMIPKTENPHALPFSARHIALARDGNFEFLNVLPGVYVIGPALNVMFGGVDQNDGAPKKLFGRYVVTVSNENISDIVVSFGSGSSLTGIIHAETNAAPPTQESTAGTSPQPSTPLPSVRLVAEDNTINAYSARTAADGTFELHDLAPERYRVTVNGIPDGTYVKAVRFGDQDITHAVLDLTAGSPGSLDIVLSPNAADVSGTVLNEKGDAVADASVTLGPMSPETAAQTQFFRQTRTDQNGRFTMKSLPPGDYRVIAWEDVDPNLVQDPEFRARFDGNSATVKLSESSHETTDPKLVSRETIESEAAKLL
jgi:protocatechuate 3,4-dioxygenase beta subunit